jgi:outer membrane lipoprotein
VVSPGLRDKVDKSAVPSLLFTDPDAFRGKIIILGGIIVDAKNTKNGTVIEVVQKPLDSRGRPLHSDRSLGRFIILYEGFLDTAIYSPDRAVTVGGEVMGKKIRPLDEIEYSYPLIKSRELYLLKPGYRSFPIRFGIGLWHSF